MPVLPPPLRKPMPLPPSSRNKVMQAVMPQPQQLAKSGSTLKGMLLGVGLTLGALGLAGGGFYAGQIKAQPSVDVYQPSTSVLPQSPEVQNKTTVAKTAPAAVNAEDLSVVEAPASEVIDLDAIEAKSVSAKAKTKAPKSQDRDKLELIKDGDSYGIIGSVTVKEPAKTKKAPPKSEIGGEDLSSGMYGDEIGGIDLGSIDGTIDTTIKAPKEEEKEVPLIAEEVDADAKVKVKGPQAKGYMWQDEIGDAFKELD